jgi:hypothetical protein
MIIEEEPTEIPKHSERYFSCIPEPAVFAGEGTL